MYAKGSDQHATYLTKALFLFTRTFNSFSYPVYPVDLVTDIFGQDLRDSQDFFGLYFQFPDEIENTQSLREQNKYCKSLFLPKAMAFCLFRLEREKPSCQSC